MIKSESASAILFRHWLRANPQFTGAYEIKDTRGKSLLPFSDVPEHQINYGLAIKSSKGVLIRVQGTNGEPDYIYLRSAPSWIVIKYPKKIEVIDVETFDMERKRSKVKSLTSHRASEISTITIPLR